MAPYRELLSVALELLHEVSRERDRLRARYRQLRDEFSRLRETIPRDAERGK